MEWKRNKGTHLELVEQEERVRKKMNSDEIIPQMGLARACAMEKRMMELVLRLESSWLVIQWRKRWETRVLALGFW